MVKIFYKNIREKKLRTLDRFKVGSWIYAENPSEEEILNIAESYELDAGLLSDATDMHEVPRLEVEDGITYIYTRFAYNDGSRILTAPILLVFGENFLLTLAERPFPLLEKFHKNSSAIYTTQKTKLLLQLLMQINTSYNYHLNNISKKIRGVSLQLELEKLNNKDIIQFVTFENVLNDFISALIPTTSILRNLLSGRYIKLYEEDKELVEDLLLANEQLIEMAKSNLRTIVNIRESYSTVMTNNLNQVVKLLTALTIIFTIPTMIASLYGMNVRLPFDQHPYAFFGIVGFIILTSVAALFVFIKNRWL